jgi:hypothetical protein
VNKGYPIMFNFSLNCLTPVKVVPNIFFDGVCMMGQSVENKIPKRIILSQDVPEKAGEERPVKN